MQQVSIRAASADDVLRCAVFDRSLCPETLTKKIAAGEVFLALGRDRPLGYLRLEYLWSKVPYIALVIVEPESRGRGIGKSLLDHVSSVLRGNGYAMLLSSSQVDEPGPQRWHRKMGFTECGIINGINEGGIGEVFFRKHL